MPDRIATMMILQSLQDIADELRALREELRPLSRSRGHASDGPSAAFGDGSEEEGLDDMRGREPKASRVNHVGASGAKVLRAKAREAP
jgi:hypothetical protein